MNINDTKRALDACVSLCKTMHCQQYRALRDEAIRNLNVRSFFLETLQA